MTPSFADDPQSHELLFDPGLLDRYFAGEATVEECDAVTRWVSGHPDRAAHLDALRRAPSGSPQPPSFDVDTFWTAVQARTTAVPAPVARRMRGVATPPPSWPPGVGGTARWRWAAIAASVLLVLGLGFGAAAVRRGAAGVRRGKEYAAAPGQRLSVTLVDGTQFTLAPTSKARIAANYGRDGGSREIELEGEAYFAVAHDAARPFAVRTRGAVARDVGTAFDVRAYPGNAGARIAVAEGAVAVAVDAERCRGAADGRSGAAGKDGGPCGAEAGAGDVATVGRSGVAVEHGVDVGAITSWMAGRLVFNHTPMRDVAAELSRWYGVDVMVGDKSLGDERMAATITGQPLDEVLTVLATLAHARVERRGGSYLLVAAGHITGDS